MFLYLLLVKWVTKSTTIIKLTKKRREGELIVLMNWFLHYSLVEHVNTVLLTSSTNYAFFPLFFFFLSFFSLCLQHFQALLSNNFSVSRGKINIEGEEEKGKEGLLQ